MMLVDEQLYFLLLCDNGEWKLREWCSRSYPSWHRNRLAPIDKDADAIQKTPPSELIFSGQKLLTLIHIESDSGSAPAEDGNTGINGEEEDDNAREQSPGEEDNMGEQDTSDNDNDMDEQRTGDGNNVNEREPRESVTQGTPSIPNASVSSLILRYTIIFMRNTSTRTQMGISTRGD